MSDRLDKGEKSDESSTNVDAYYSSVRDLSRVKS
jgi:hypothetical protein